MPPLMMFLTFNLWAYLFIQIFICNSKIGFDFYPSYLSCAIWNRSTFVPGPEEDINLKVKSVSQVKSSRRVLLIGLM